MQVVIVAAAAAAAEATVSIKPIRYTGKSPPPPPYIFSPVVCRASGSFNIPGLIISNTLTYIHIYIYLHIHIYGVCVCIDKCFHPCAMQSHKNKWQKKESGQCLDNTTDEAVKRITMQMMHVRYNTALASIYTSLRHAIWRRRRKRASRRDE